MPEPARLANAVQRVCATPLEPILRSRLSGMVPCGNRAVVHVQVDLNGHVLDVVGYDGDPCCTDTGPPEMMDGATVFYDDAPYRPEQHDGQPVTTSIGPLTGLSDERAARLLQAVLILRGARAQIVSATDQEDLFVRWPEARIAVMQAPPHLTTTPRGRTLRVWNERRVSERGGSCHLLEEHKVTLTGEGQLVFGDPAVFGEGERLGQACAEPLPSR